MMLDQMELSQEPGRKGNTMAQIRNIPTNTQTMVKLIAVKRQLLGPNLGYTAVCQG